MTELHRYVVPSQGSRYILSKEELEAYLIDRYDKNINFDVSHERDKFQFSCPEILDKDDLLEIPRDIASKRTKAAAEAKLERERARAAQQ